MMVTCILIMDFGIHSVLNSLDKYFASTMQGRYMNALLARNNAAGCLHESSPVKQEEC